MNVNFPRFTTITCPYCNHKNTIKIDYTMSEFNPSIVVCDSETGGCDRSFAVRINLEISYELFELIPHIPTYTEIQKEEEVILESDLIEEL
jgi:hypothetical protein